MRTLEYVCRLAGAAAVLWFAFVYWDRVSFQASEANKFADLALTNATTGPLHRGELFGEISIPRLGMKDMIAEGVDGATLRRAVGHIPGTAAPGMPGTVALAAHRDTFFRPLSRIRVNDLILLDTGRGKYKYRVARTFVTTPNDVGVVRASSGSDLTLVTCYPFWYIGPAPKRFVVEAVHVGRTAERAAYADAN
ncbi:MAG TPA: class D sortase [Candidatus Acidoferrales bacterium]|nr:class D sortase [Candidatus Acidoferrales bacterium]